MFGKHSLIVRCLGCIVCIPIVSCIVAPEPPAPQSTTVAAEPPVVQVYAVDAPDIGTVEALDAAASGPVVLGRNRLDRAVYLSDYGDKVVLVNYWNSTCGACWQHIADLDRLYREYSKLGLIVVNVNYGEPAPTIADYLAKRDPGRATIQLRDRSGQASEAQGVVSVPAAILFAPDRSVVARYGNDLQIEWIRRDLNDLLRRTNPS